MIQTSNTGDLSRQMATSVSGGSENRLCSQMESLPARSSSSP